MPDHKRSYYLFAPKSLSESQPMPLYVFLMGFDHLENPSKNTRNNYFKIARAAEENNFLAVFPRGMPGSFPEIPGARAWYPEYFQENQRFLASLTAWLCTKLPVNEKHIVMMGFSNGGYFGSIDALTNAKSPFTGFWLDGGSYPYAFNKQVEKKPIFISCGENDYENRPHVEKFREFIQENGWSEGVNLETFMHKSGHAFNNQSLTEGLKFFAAFFGT